MPTIPLTPSYMLKITLTVKPNTWNESLLPFFQKLLHLFILPCRRSVNEKRQALRNAQLELGGPMPSPAAETTHLQSLASARMQQEGEHSHHQAEGCLVPQLLRCKVRRDQTGQAHVKPPYLSTPIYLSPCDVN